MKIARHGGSYDLKQIGGFSGDFGAAIAEVAGSIIEAVFEDADDGLQAKMPGYWSDSGADALDIDVVVPLGWEDPTYRLNFERLVESEFFEDDWSESGEARVRSLADRLRALAGRIDKFADGWSAAG